MDFKKKEKKREKKKKRNNGLKEVHSGLPVSPPPAAGCAPSLLPQHAMEVTENMLMTALGITCTGPVQGLLKSPFPQDTETPGTERRSLASNLRPLWLHKQLPHGLGASPVSAVVKVWLLALVVLPDVAFVAKDTCHPIISLSHVSAHAGVPISTEKSFCYNFCLCRRLCLQ